MDGESCASCQFGAVKRDGGYGNMPLRLYIQCHRSPPAQWQNVGPDDWCGEYARKVV